MTIDWGTVLSSLGINLATVSALSAWLGKVWAGRILEGDRAKYAKEIERIKNELERSSRVLQAEIDRTIHVTSLQFDTEFKALMEIWRRVVANRASMAYVTHSDVFKDSTPDEVKAGFAGLQKTYGDLLDASEQQSPFYPNNIRDRLIELIAITGRENREGRSQDLLTEAWFARGAKNYDEYANCAITVSDMIRDRISSLSVIEKK